MALDMKTFALLIAAVALSSCNTLIGIGRDTKEGFIWTKNKIQESRQPSHEEQYGAPVY